MNVEKWLREYLKDGKKHPVCDVRKEAKKKGFLKADLKSARLTVKIETVSEYNPEKGYAEWFWRLK